MTAFSIMAHALHRELAARGVDIGLADCEEMLRRAVDRASDIASRKSPEVDRHDLTSGELITLRALGERTWLPDSDTTTTRVLVNRGYAQRLGLGQIAITDAGRARLAQGREPT
ncbi:hypothetical protein [Bradyrhizobium sp. SZCCHNR1020]|uniref:hypothetical protein n=1 Tax=Bradyrhizobium sp. SZCCHNR1020 TaxID=3057343 RepID=UPI002915C686|nr:hypothetical protein [Bradyrhizobium sp. SZCCHNR1020]